MKRYVGYSELYHDAALSIIEEDGSVVYASMAERFTQRKGDPVIVDEQWKLVNQKDDHFSYYEDTNKRTHEHFGDPYETRMESITPDETYDHHVSHCAGAFFTRPWESTEDTVMVSIDGHGEIDASCIFDHNFKPILNHRWPKSLGAIYSAVCREMGFKMMQEEYIVMGLASYGKVDDKLYNILHNCYHWHESPQGIQRWKEYDDQNHSLRDSEVSYKWVKYLTRLANRTKEIPKEDAAHTVQKFFETEVLEIMKEARKYGSKLVYSGGCAQNVTANTLIRELFDDMHIAVQPTDAGSSLGCAAMSWHKETGGTNLKWSPYLGYNIERDIDPKEVAQYLVDNKVCGVANGRAEFGPRALGNRSLLADVRYDVKDTVNDIKRRQRFRPFAPAILSEYADEYFEGHMGEYMQYTAVAKHPYDSVTHVDGTARVQLVKPDCESVLRQILEEYYKLTGVPMLLNTSLNIKGFPMVNTLEHAMKWEKNYKVKVF
jgi:carbamoyltransferase